jgi:2'-5' RNA ligase
MEKEMAKELMWVCGIVLAELNNRLARLCKSNNRDLHLPEDVFKFPLHISLKKSFYTTAFDEVKSQIKDFISERGKINCRAGEIEIHKNMIWLPIEAKGELASWHNDLDKILLKKFNIPILPFDANFHPHISLFTKGNEEQIHQMYARLKPQIQPMDITLDRFVIGSSMHKDEFMDI